MHGLLNNCRSSPITGSIAFNFGYYIFSDKTREHSSNNHSKMASEGSGLLDEGGATRGRAFKEVHGEFNRDRFEIEYDPKFITNGFEDFII